MAALRGLLTGLVVLGVPLSAVGAEKAPTLKGSAKVGDTTRVLVTLKAEGLYRPGPPPGQATATATATATAKAKAKAKAEAEAVKPLTLKVETRLDFVERVVDVEPGGRARRSVRRVVQAASAINGEIRPTSAVLRPELALLVAETRAEGVVVVSAGGPLTRSELELVQGVGDPLALADLLPAAAIAPGGTWKVGDAAARALSAYDTLSDNSLKATLGTVDDRSARVHLSGDVRGLVLGAEGKMLMEGDFTFDRQAGRIDLLTLKRSEARRPGAVEAGLDVKSTLTVTRRAAEVPPELADEVLSGMSTGPDPRRELLLMVAPAGKYTLRHDRDWHTYWTDTRLTVLKRLDRGAVVAQCNLMAGPAAGKGRHQDLEQFRSDIRRALGARFADFQGEGEVDGEQPGAFRYKVGVRGREGQLGVLWYYYLLASPDGDQVLGTFTLAEDQAKAFGDQDVRLIGSIRWKDASSSPPVSTSPAPSPSKP